MKRGLAILNPAETTAADFSARLEALRAKLRGSGNKVVLIYGDVSRSADLHYLTNLCLYWNEAVLAVPIDGNPALITKLSKRVQPWMKATTVLEDIRSTPKLAENVGKFLNERYGACNVPVGVADMAWWPDNLIMQLRNALPKSELNDVPGLVRDQRLAPAPEELKLLQHAARLLNEGVESAWTEGNDANQRTSNAVRNVRRAGFQDAYVNYTSLPDGTAYIDAIGQYSYVWVRQSRPRGGAMAHAVNDALRAAIDAIKPGVTEQQLAGVAASRVDGNYKQSFSCVPAPQIETRGMFRPGNDSRRPLKEREVVAITLSLACEQGVVSASETMRITQQGAAAL